MVSIIAHEFNNILTPIISYCQLAKQASDGDPIIRKALDKSLIGAEKAARISASMLGFARDDIEATESDIRAVINESLNCMARDPAKDGIELTVEAPSGCWVKMEPISFQQVIINLILNASQVMRQRGGSLKISATPMGPYTTILIADTGPGIAPDILPTIFDPFVSHRDTDTVTGSKGTGLGLAICRDLIERVGGKIDIPRSDDSGTTFRIQLLTAAPPSDSDSLC
ncbi:MAG: sensor histidine kinase, partial [Planctomycetota bacterium]|jgi:signal transduction histidine kinase